MSKKLAYDVCEGAVIGFVIGMCVVCVGLLFYLLYLLMKFKLGHTIAYFGVLVIVFCTIMGIISGLGKPT